MQEEGFQEYRLIYLRWTSGEFTIPVYKVKYSGLLRLNKYTITESSLDSPCIFVREEPENWSSNTHVQIWRRPGFIPLKVNLTKAYGNTCGNFFLKGRAYGVSIMFTRLDTGFQRLYLHKIRFQYIIVP